MSTTDTGLSQQERIAVVAEVLQGIGDRLGWWEK